MNHYLFLNLTKKFWHLNQTKLQPCHNVNPVMKKVRYACPSVTCRFGSH